MIYILNGNSSEEITNPKDLTLQDAQALATSSRAREIAYVAPVFNSSSDISYLDNNIKTSILGTTSDYEFVQNLTIEEGIFITDQQVEGRSAVVVLGPEIARSLFGKSGGVVAILSGLGDIPTV